MVVTKITPLAPRTPKTAVEDASFNTLIFSTSLGSICVKSRSTPSTKISGVELLLFNDPIPRIKIAGLSAPGSPEYCTAETPFILPARAFPSEATGVFKRSVPLIDEIAPVIVTFFCVP